MQHGMHTVVGVLPKIGLFSSQDSSLIRRLNFLTTHGVLLWSATNTDRLLRQFKRDPVDLLLLDVGQGDQSHVALIRQLSDLLELPVIVLCDSQVMPWLSECLDAGADRYLPRTVNEQLLLANVRAVFRQQQKFRRRCLSLYSQPEQTPPPWKLDHECWVLISPAGFRMELSKLELRLIQILSAARGAIIPKNELAQLVYDNRYENPASRMDMLISRLRKKARLNLHQTLPIKTTYSGGYAFSAHVLEHTGCADNHEPTALLPGYQAEL